MLKPELIEWETVKDDNDYPDDDNNEGYIYGVYWKEGDEIIEIEWFKTEEERLASIREQEVIFDVSLEDAIENIDEIIADLEDLTDEDLINVRNVILERAQKVSVYLQELEY